MTISRAQKKKKAKAAEFDKDFWMVTFGDLLSLLLTFFVLLFSMSTLDNKVLKEMFTAFAGGAGPLELTEIAPTSPLISPRLTLARQMGYKEFMEFLKKERGREKAALEIEEESLLEGLLLADVTISRRGPSFVLSFPSKNMFRPGSAAINPEILPTLKRLGEVLRFSQSELIIEGHTDDIPISTDRFPSNWELSAARAANVMRYMAGNTPVGMDRLSAVGYADTRPLAPNLSESYRARNRRVDIVIRQAPAGEGYGGAAGL